ncbi:MAG: gamma-glutamyl-gamma-aminobutyrate hydrolase family protein [Bacteroidota bacterium]
MKIGLTYTGYEHKHQNYFNWLKGDDDIEIITLSIEEDNAARIKECDGLVLSGGIDIHSDLYNGPHDYPHKPEEGWNTERDLFEKGLYEYALKNSLPILGVCRGLQLVNVLQGGTLKQDLGDLNDSHKAVQELDKEHVIDVYNNTLLSEIVTVKSGKVNSAHHQVIDKLGEDLMINCLSDDGAIEGTEWKDKKGKPFMLCVQWHPERMYKFQLADSPLSKNIRNRFIVEIIKSKSEKNENH